MMSSDVDMKGADATAGSISSFLKRIGRLAPIRAAVEIFANVAIPTIHEKIKGRLVN